ncbi:MAG: FtsX-like permease family protein, partial [Bacteroidales bacterium]|nr:FtsX-like permease family protein [Bacteroidales bacterium]
GVKYNGIQKRIQSMVGKDYVVKNHFELQETLYNVMRSEKMAVYLILSFILLIAAFNLIGTLSMLIIDKEKDNTIIWSMGATQQTVKKIYYTESLLMTAIGAISGVVLGVIVCLIQIRFKLIKFAPGSSFVVDAYPIKILGGDLLLIFSTVIIIGALTALIPISRLKITINYNRK